jgi:hypothetical protein
VKIALSPDRAGGMHMNGLALLHLPSPHEWQIVFFAADGRPTSHNLYGITCAAAAICYAVGDNGTIVARR